MEEKKMTLGELIGWLDSNDISYEIDGAGGLTVKGSLQGYFRDWVKTCRYTSLPAELVYVNGNLWLEQTSIVSLGGLTSVGGSLDLAETPIASLGNLASVGRDLCLQDTPIASLGNLTSVKGNLRLQDTPLTSLGNLTSVSGFLNLRNTPLASLGNLTSVVWGLDLQGTPLTSLDNLPRVGRQFFLDRDQLQLFTREVLRKVEGNILYWGLAENEWVTLSPDELEAIIAENERRDSLNSVRESDVDWDLYDR